VKTLHPKVHGGLLAIRSNPQHQAAVKEHGIEFIDMVIVNLYPFEKTAMKPGVTLEDLIENIDIGGPSMLRSAAKNFEDVTVLVDAADYAGVLEELGKNNGSISRETRARLARKAFATTAAYDGAISTTLQKMANGVFPDTLHLNYRKVMDLRYGENPHQKAALYRDPATAGRGLAAAPQLQGKEFSEPTTVIIKHTNPCGVASATTLVESYQRALEVDPVSAYGSVIAFNRAVDGPAAEELSKLFVEAVVAPGYEASALKHLAGKKNLRLLDMSATAGDEFGLQLKAVGGGLLIQTSDSLPAQPDLWKCVTERQPSAEETEALIFAWRIVKHVKSNAIVYARAGVLVGVGAGQMSRVDSVKLGASKARDLKHAVEGTVLASDAFFPFPDGVEEAARVGVTAIVQPGGSVRDNEVIAVANQHGITMVLTGVRHFSH
jgi:phosphoribosylaminoimidazolecarboxamide formyltransferase/IMP cyclohydrolase